MGDDRKRRGIGLNRFRSESTLGNARAFLETQDQQASFDRFLSGFVDGLPSCLFARIAATQSA